MVWKFYVDEIVKINCINACISNIFYIFYANKQIWTNPYLHYLICFNPIMQWFNSITFTSANHSNIAFHRQRCAEELTPHSEAQLRPLSLNITASEHNCIRTSVRKCVFTAITFNTNLFTMLCFINRSKSLSQMLNEWHISQILCRLRGTLLLNSWQKVGTSGAVMLLWYHKSFNVLSY